MIKISVPDNGGICYYRTQWSERIQARNLITSHSVFRTERTDIAIWFALGTTYYIYAADNGLN